MLLGDRVSPSGSYLPVVFMFHMFLKIQHRFFKKLKEFIETNMILILLNKNENWNLLRFNVTQQNVNFINM